MKILIKFYYIDQFKLFFNEFSVMDEKTGNKQFKYRDILTKLAHREEVALVIDLDDVKDFDFELAEAISINTRRYVNILLNVSIISN